LRQSSRSERNNRGQSYARSDEYWGSHLRSSYQGVRVSRGVKSRDIHIIPGVFWGHA
jgi:hypothetical protein